MRIKWTTIVLSLVCAIILIAAPFLKPGEPGTDFREEKPTGIIRVMQIDEFEGGTGSRAEWLKKRAVEFEAKNKGVFVEVATGSLLQLESAMKTGDLPDLVSFSVGAGETVYPALMPYDGGEYARDEIADGGKAGRNTYAVPWCMGGYALIAYEDYLKKAGMPEGKSLRESAFSAAVTAKNAGETVQLQSLSVGFSMYSNPMQCLKINAPDAPRGENAMKLDYQKTQFFAYDAFVGGYASTMLLGTQRDVIRCTGKLEAGKIRPLRMEPLGKWTDLVQYIGIVKTEDKAKYRYEVKFLEFLQSDEVQQKLTGIGMMSVIGSTLYSSGWQAELEAALNGELTVQNVFTPKATIESARRAAEGKA